MSDNDTINTDGEVGEYSKSDIVVTAGQETLLGDLNWDIPRNKGKLLWEIGIPDRSSYEFAHGHTDFFEGFVYDNFVNEFSNPIEYNVEEKNWDTALPYVHCPLKINESILTGCKIEKGTCNGTCAVSNNLPQGTYVIKLMQADKGVQLKLVKY